MPSRNRNKSSSGKPSDSKSSMSVKHSRVHRVTLPEMPAVKKESIKLNHVSTSNNTVRKVAKKESSNTRHIVMKRTLERRRRKSFLTTFGFFSPIIFILALLVTVLGGSGAAALAYYNSESQNIANLPNELPRDSVKVYDSNGTLLYQWDTHGSQTTVQLSQISPLLINATIAVEDKDFWSNPGVNFNADIRAAIDDLQNNHIVSGASTITQQLVKRAILGDQVTFQRKLEEMILAIGITQQYSKQQILTMYLNTIYYGEQAYGIDAAANTYFNLQDSNGKTAAQQLDLAQASMLAGIPQSPTANDPMQDMQAALARQDDVLSLMVKQGYITDEDKAKAEQETQQPGFIHPAQHTNLAPHFVNYVLDQLNSMIDAGTLPLQRSGLSVYTTLNLNLQNQIQQIMQQHVSALKYHNVTNSAEVLMDYHTGAVISLLGSIDYNNTAIDGQYDVATQAYRQPGSSFKPFAYVTAFENGWSPGTPICDCPLSVPMGEGQPPYTPHNYDLRYHGIVTARYALQNSLNIPAVRTLLYAGIDPVLQTAKSMGITSYQGTPGPSLVLGGLGVHLIDETAAYGVFANGGVKIPPHSIDRIVDENGKTLYHYQNTQGQQILTPQMSYMITNMLEDNRTRAPEFGICSPLQLGPLNYGCSTSNERPAAAKTGTTNDFKDNWTMGYTTDFVMGVWTGNDNGTPMYNVSGIDGAAPIWHDSMILAEQGKPFNDFTEPTGLVKTAKYYPQFHMTTIDLQLASTGKTTPTTSSRQSSSDAIWSWTPTVQPSPSAPSNPTQTPMPVASPSGQTDSPASQYSRKE